MSRIILPLLLLSLPLAGWSQTVFRGGISAGAVTTQISGDGLGGWDKFGFAGGAWIRAYFREPWSASMGLQYIQKGSRTKQDTINFQSFAYVLDYVEMPLTVGYRLNHWRFSLGGYAGFLVSQRVIANGFEFDVNPPFRTLDTGLAGGIAYLAGERWIIELRGSTSVLPTRPSPNFANQFSFYERGNYNQVLQFMLGYQF